MKEKEGGEKEMKREQLLREMYVLFFISIFLSLSLFLFFSPLKLTLPYFPIEYFYSFLNTFYFGSSGMGEGMIFYTSDFPPFISPKVLVLSPTFFPKGNK